MSDTKLGLWANDNLADTLSQYTGSQYYHSLPESAQFIHSVAKILAMRKAVDKDLLCRAPSFYILAPPPEGIDVTLKREPAFSLGGVNVSGKVWFGGPAFNSSKGTLLPDDTDADIAFTFISQELCSGEFPTLYFDGTTNDAILRYYPNGIDDPDNCEDILFGGMSINDVTLKQALDKIHERSLITPTASIASKKLWNDGQKYYPCERAENAVQSIIEIGLATSLGNVRVKCEETGVYGRYDIALVEQDPLDPTKTVNHAILELKIVKNFTSSGNSYSNKSNQIAIVKGIKQAFAYRKEHGSRISALCCYDMRPTPDLSNHSGKKCKLASDLEVKFWAWPLFPTTEAARDMLVKNQLG